ncbi:Cytochrome c heme lyase subunit CcmF [Fulvivirga imtechensis AK7]|uniref:Cytochrome c heme lyase subunit CcmF n=1 Tax=Fulvivirga imtechensis AK7 TaxID=1237149 RepID=L8JV39_9BACT|nr:cytochrome c biogenesis protein CcsA [Fulvivirga imtechensis]ELR71449.1 Cytochrome c heme lyase subunit CcmF [Fulvivirga imtechensis AK7]
MIHEFIGDLGHIFVVIAFITALYSAFSYFQGAQAKQFDKQHFWKQNGRIFFYVHALAVAGIVFSLFYIIYNHYFEYHYAWSHSSKRLPTHYMISCFWEGQEGSFLLWLFWHALLGIIVIVTNKFWEAPVMAIFSLVQAFLASMILGVVIPGLDLKLGSSPFILLRDAIDAPIFQQQPNFVPEDGTGLNPLLQNYWMVIHPPTLFLGFATTLVPFAYVIAGLWKKKYREWVRPALPWALVSGAVLGLGILMGGYWAYETLNFGGYWNWDPVENAVYVPWLFLVAAIHTMITFKNSNTALKASVILVITTFVLILYSTFLTRSGILGDASVHSFTDLGLSGQLLVYLLFFTVGAIVLAIVRWKEMPTTEKEASTYSREFWIFIGALVLCLMGFQVIIPTSIPVYNAIVELFGGVSNLAPPAEQVEFYSKFQLWFAVAVGLLSGTGQFFWWKNIDKKQLKSDLALPVVITLILTALVVVFKNVAEPSYIILLMAGIYTAVANGKILVRVLKKNPKLSGGAVTHIGVGLILIGVMFSAGYSKVVSLNTTGMLISKESSSEFNNENLLLFVNEPKEMADYQLKYRGERIEAVDISGYLNRDDLKATAIPHLVVAKRDITVDDKVVFQKSDTIEIAPENTYYEIEYTDKNGNKFTLYPRAQVNEAMGGLLASPDIKRDLTRDLYTHVSSIRDPNEEPDWSDMEEFEVSPNKNFFVNDYVTRIEKIERIPEVEGVELTEKDVAVKVDIIMQGEDKDYLAQPVFLVKDGMVGRIPDEVNDLGVKLTVLNVHPERNSFSIGVNTRQKNWVVLKAMEKPLINVLWSGTLLLMVGFGIAINRRYSEFKKMREKGQE